MRGQQCSEHGLSVDERREKMRLLQTETNSEGEQSAAGGCAVQTRAARLCTRIQTLQGFLHHT